MPNRLTYVEIPAEDGARAAAFYEATMGWTMERRSEGDWRFHDESAHLIGRFVAGRPATTEPGLLPFFYVDHITDTVANHASRTGGEIAVEPYREGDVWAARLRDPFGNVIGVWQFATVN
jgi:predicted enzyme related to lactoylglutathione lyase